MNLTFYKYQGAGNDFVILDNRGGEYSILSTAQIHHLCDRRFGIGADGLMMLQNKEGYDFEMKYFNADGREGSMCGNGGRCMVRFAAHLGLHADGCRFMAVDGPHEAEIDNHDRIRLKMIDVQSVTQLHGDFILNTGSPHYVRIVNDLDSLDVFEKGREIRYGHHFAADGINVNFIEEVDADEIRIRTYERGVEDETLACGTGVTAAALVSYHNEFGFNTVKVHARGGLLEVEFDRKAEGKYENIWLCGPAEFVFKGAMEL